MRVCHILKKKYLSMVKIDQSTRVNQSSFFEILKKRKMFFSQLTVLKFPPLRLSNWINLIQPKETALMRSLFAPKHRYFNGYKLFNFSNFCLNNNTPSTNSSSLEIRIYYLDLNQIDTIFRKEVTFVYKFSNIQTESG